PSRVWKEYRRDLGPDKGCPSRGCHFFIGYAHDLNNRGSRVSSPPWAENPCNPFWLVQLGRRQNGLARTAHRLLLSTALTSNHTGRVHPIVCFRLSFPSLAKAARRGRGRPALLRKKEVSSRAVLRCFRSGDQRR